MPETKRKTKTKARPPADPPIVGKVWRFVNYASRWGGGLEGLKMQVPKYVRWYINAWQGAEGEVVSALNALRAEPDFIWLQGALVELLSRATNTEPIYQGYILTSRHKPATAAHVGRMLRVDQKPGSNSSARGVLTKLARAGFLEYVELPASPSPQQPKRRKSQVSGSDGTPRAQKGGKRPKKRAGKSRSRASLSKGKGKNLLAQVNGKGSAQEVQSMRRVRLIDQVKQMQEQPGATTSADATGVVPPTTAPSTTSTSSDGPGRAGPTTRRMPARPSIQKLGEITSLRQHRYNPAAWEFADEVLVRLGYLSPAEVDRVRAGGKHTPEVECERAHWAKAYDDAGREFAPGDVAWLRKHIDNRVDTVRAHANDYTNPRAYLMRAWYNLTKDLKRKGKALA
jgi:hypothetical protein